jgi:hypothetical protein
VLLLSGLAVGWAKLDPCAYQCNNLSKRPLYIWMFTPSAMSIFRWICAL